MENTKYKLLQALRNSGTGGIIDAYQWVQQHKDELNKEVYGPVLLEVHLENFSYLLRLYLFFNNFGGFVK